MKFLDYFANESPFHPKRLIIAIIMLLGGYYFMNNPQFIMSVVGDSGAFTAYFALLLAGSIALILMFNVDTYKKLFQKMAKGSWKYIILAVVLGFAVTIVTLVIGGLFDFPSSANGSLTSAGGSGSGSGGGNAGGSGMSQALLISTLITLGFTCISLVGEEVFTAAINFPLFRLFTDRGINIKKAWIWSAVIASLFFGLMHFEAYDGNIYQCLVPIGLGRLPFTYAWYKTESLWGGIWAHIIYDLMIMVPLMFFPTFFGIA